MSVVPTAAMEIDPAALADFTEAHALVDRDRYADAIALYARGLHSAPHRFRERLTYARALELNGQEHAALLNFYRSVKDAQTKGRWLNDLTTSPILRDLVLHAIDVIDVGRRQLFDASLTPFRDAHGSESLRRVDACLAIYLGERPAQYDDPNQRSKFLHFPGLPTRAFFARTLFPWYAELEKNTAVIREELDALLGENGNFEPFLDIPSPDLVPQFLGGEKPNWNAFFFYRHGERYDANCARCPRTSAILEALPLVRIAEHAPEICFSVLTPDTHILPHHGSTNTRLVTHLPLIVPPDCAIRVGDEVHEWKEGECITFDDTFLHEAWNRSDRTRAVLILDVWNPYLSDIEKAGITALIAAIRQFNRECGVIAE